MLKLKRIICGIIVLFSVFLSPNVQAQNENKIEIPAEQITLKNLIQIIEKSSDYTFVYDNSVQIDKICTIKKKTNDIHSIVKQALEDKEISYEFVSKQIILRQASNKKGKVSKEIRGKVKGEDGEPIIGANVIVKGNAVNGTITDIDGAFILKDVSDDSVIQVSYMGFRTSEVKASSIPSKGIILKEDSELLDEVVVVGYDSQKKVNLTGSVTSISNKEFENQPIVQSSTILQGLASGVTVTSNGGAPGSETAVIRVRGLGTFGGSSSSPLILIDGVEGNMNDVDPAQIDKISVLKDAASSAIYGSRAANGVILVTTKRGKDGSASVSYRAYMGWQTPTTLPKNVNARDYMILSREASENDGSESIYTDEYINNYLENNYLDPDNYPMVDWQKRLITESGFTHNHNVTLNASTKKIRLLTSFGYLDQGAIIKNTSYKRISLRNNIDADITDKLHFRFDISGVYGGRDQNPYQSNLFMFANARDPLMLAQWSDGNYAPFTGGSVNILPMIEQNVGGNLKKKSYKLNLAAALTYDPFNWLTLSATVAPRFTLSNSHSFKDLVTYYSDPYGTVSSVSNLSWNSLTESSNQYYYGNYQFTAMFHKTFNKVHNVKVLFGASDESMDERTLQAYRQDFEYPMYDVISAGGDNEFKDNDGKRYEWELRSFFGRINYNYKERYLFEANLRCDGSSRFAKGNQWGYFPSFSAAWRMTEEPFMQKYRNTLSEFKLRASYGQLGNQNIGSDYYPTIQTLTISSISANNIIYPIVGLNNLANTDITWESSEMYDMGFDAVLWNSLSVTADFYYKTTNDILLKLDIPASIGLVAPYQNAGKVRNIGWELALGYRKQWNDFSFSVNANLSDVKNKIIDMKGTTGGSGVLRNQEGSSINSLYGLKCLGIARNYQTADYINLITPQYNTTTHAGDLIYEDYNGDNKIDDNDRQIIGSTIPRYTYGMTLNLGWKGFNIMAQLQGVGKANAYISGYYTQPCVQGGTFRVEELDRWTPDNVDGSYPRLSYSSTLNTKSSSFWMADASYCRLKNLQLSYTIPQKVCKRMKLFKSCMLFANATNLFTITNFYQGYDPETTYSSNATDGVVAGAVADNYPSVKTFTVGFDVKF